MKNNDLFYFLGKCLSLGENVESNKRVIDLICNEEVDWERFVAVASNHLVLPSVYLRFKKQGIISCLPIELSKHLLTVYEMNYQRNTSILKQIDRINRLLSTAGIVPIYLKGAGNLLDQLYEDVGERMLGDIDFLVSDAEFLQCARILKSAGYEHFYPFYDDMQAVTKHFPRLIHPNEPADVEIHRLPVEKNLSSHFNYETISPEIKPVTTVPLCYVLSDQHKVILNFMHGFMAADVRPMRNVSYRNIVDFYLLSGRVNVYDILSGLPQYAAKALVYADFAHHALGVDTRRKQGLHSRIFIWKDNVFLSSKTTYRLTWLVSYLFSRIWSGYLQNAIKMFYDKQTRKSVFRRLSDLGWYKLHLKSYTDNFHKNFL